MRKLFDLFCSANKGDVMKDNKRPVKVVVVNHGKKETLLSSLSWPKPPNLGHPSQACSAGNRYRKARSCAVEGDVREPQSLRFQPVNSGAGNSLCHHDGNGNPSARPRQLYLL